MTYVLGALLLAVIGFGIWMYRQGGQGKAAQQILKDKESGDANEKVAQNELTTPPATDEQQLEWLHKSPDE